MDVTSAIPGYYVRRADRSQSEERLRSWCDVHSASEPSARRDRSGVIEVNDATRTDLMRQAIEVGKAGIAAGQSPFGAVIAARTGEVVIAAHNRVRADGDVTAHAEIVAIRGACSRLGTIDLAGHVIATTCEPCPMCAAAIHWARLEAVIFGADIDDARAVSFNELLVSTQSVYDMGGSGVRVYAGVLRDECAALFELWKDGPNPTPY